MYADELARFPVDVVEAVVDRHIRLGDRWPSAAELIRACHGEKARSEPQSEALRLGSQEERDRVRRAVAATSARLASGDGWV